MNIIFAKKQQIDLCSREISGALDSYIIYDKLLEKQKEGKKRMKQFGDVEVPQEAFLKVLKLSD